MKSKKSALLLVGLLYSQPLQAAAVELVAVPTSWRMQDYMNGAIDVWYSGSSCAYGRMQIPTTASADSKNRFWSLILTAKATNQPVAIFYDNATPYCTIVDFSSKEQ